MRLEWKRVEGLMVREGPRVELPSSQGSSTRVSSGEGQNSEVKPDSFFSLWNSGLAQSLQTKGRVLPARFGINEKVEPTFVLYRGFQ